MTSTRFSFSLAVATLFGAQAHAQSFGDTISLNESVGSFVSVNIQHEGGVNDAYAARAQISNDFSITQTLDTPPAVTGNFGVTGNVVSTNPNSSFRVERETRFPGVSAPDVVQSGFGNFSIQATTQPVIAQFGGQQNFTSTFTGSQVTPVVSQSTFSMPSVNVPSPASQPSFFQSNTPAFQSGGGFFSNW